MNNQRISVVSVVILLVASLMMLAVPVAACNPVDGTGGNDNIVCDATNPIDDSISSISGRNGSDTITVLPGGGDDNDGVFGDNSSEGIGNDSIVISGSVGNVYGDVDSTGVFGTLQAQAGSDTIVVTNGGSANRIWGDLLSRDGGDTNPRGGNDRIVIDNGGTVQFTIYGDGIGDSTGVTTDPNPAGNDTIIINGVIGNGSGSGGDVIADEIFGRANADGGDDSIVIGATGIVEGDILGDDVEDDGGNDTIAIAGSVGGDVYGDYMEQMTRCCSNNGGSDSITVLGTVSGTVYGDFEGSTISIAGIGGKDTITVSGQVGSVVGDHIEANGGNDSITIAAGGHVVDSVVGDLVDRSGAGPGNGGADIIEIMGNVGGVVYGDDAPGDGGNDTIIVHSGAGVQDQIVGDLVSANGGDDSIVIFGVVNGGILGDASVHNGGDDTIVLRNNGTFAFTGDIYGDFGTSRSSTSNGGNDLILIENGTADIFVDGNVFGDGIKHDALGGKDTIIIEGTVSGFISGDDDDFAGRSRRDTIMTEADSSVKSISGDLTKKAGSKDTITVGGTVENSVFGDNVNRAGGSDFIEVTSSGLVRNNVVGDQAKTITGGNDTIHIRGQVNKNVFGDNFRASAKPDANGGDDTIIIFNGALVKGDVVGDSAPNNGGDDKITIAGTVNGDVIGDQVNGTGGVDTIKVTANGRVKGDVIGDDAGTPANVPNTGQDDVFIINGIVDGTVYLDNLGGPTFDAAGRVAGFDLATGGNDIVVVAGQVGGNILSAPGSDGDDIFVIQNGATVGGMMDAGAHIDGDSLIFDLSTTSKGEFNALSELFDGLRVEDGRVRYRGNAYNWVNFELLDFFIQYLETRTVPLVCNGIYEKNAEGTACVRKGQEEIDAILFHRNNPGYDGRMPGTEACAIYNYGDAMRVYEVVSGNEGELVTTISADVFSHNIESNLLLASSASGMVNVYYLTSHEVQVECTDYTGKTQVRIIPDFSGTVNASFDKEA